MEQINRFQETEDRIVIIRDIPVLIDRDVAELYGVTTRRINEAVRNNPEKFPKGYIFRLQHTERQYLVENFDRFKTLKNSTVEPTAFTERGLYMLATILKSPIATETTISIIETFTKVRELSRAIYQANSTGVKPSQEVQNGIQRRLTDVLNNNLPKKMQKVTMGLNLGFIKFEVEMKWEGNDKSKSENQE